MEIKITGSRSIGVKIDSLRKISREAQEKIEIVVCGGMHDCQFCSETFSEILQKLLEKEEIFKYFSRDFLVILHHKFYFSSFLILKCNFSFFHLSIKKFEVT